MNILFLNLRKIIAIMLFFIPLKAALSSTTLQFFKKNPPPQDVLVNNKTIVKSMHSSHLNMSYELIKKIVGRYNRIVTIADVCPNYGYFSIRCAQDYKAVCVMMDEGKYIRNSKIKTSHVLKEICQANTKLDSLILLESAIDHNRLAQLADCEHFDVVLVLGILHKMGKSWSSFADDMLALGENIIIETPTPESLVPGIGVSMRKQIQDYIAARKGILVGTIKGKNKVVNNIYVIHREKKSVRMCCWNDPRPQSSHTIISDFEKKVFKKGERVRPWHPGINLMTFRSLGGIYPTQDYIYKKFEEIAAAMPKGATTVISGNCLTVLPERSEPGI